MIIVTEQCSWFHDGSHFHHCGKPAASINLFASGGAFELAASKWQWHED